MTPPRAEFMARLAEERDKRAKERCRKRKAADRQWQEYRKAVFARQYRCYDQSKRV